MSYKIMKTKWYKLNIGNKKIIYRKTVDGLFSFLPKLSQTFLYLEVEKATDQNLNQKAGSALWELNELASPPESCQIGFRISPRTIGLRMNRNRGLHQNIAAAMAFLAKRRIDNDTPEWCRPGGVRILETIHDMAEAACDGANGLGVPWDGIHAWTRQTSTVWKKIAPVYSGVTDNRSRVAEGNFCHTLVLPVKRSGKQIGGKENGI